jgi:hypothetical protein
MQEKNVFDWRGPSVFLLDKKMKQVANGAKAGQIASQKAMDKLNERKQIVIYSKGKEGAKTKTLDDQVVKEKICGT